MNRNAPSAVAVGVVVRGAAQACLSVSMPSVRCDPHQLPSLIATLGAAARRVEADLAAAGSGRRNRAAGLGKRQATQRNPGMADAAPSRTVT